MKTTKEHRLEAAKAHWSAFKGDHSTTWYSHWLETGERPPEFADKKRDISRITIQDMEALEAIAASLARFHARSPDE